jgi:hypothetical protein
MGTEAVGRMQGRTGARRAGAVLLAITVLLLALPASGGATVLSFGPGTTSWTVPNNVLAATVRVIGGSGGKDGSVNSACTPGRAQDITLSGVSVTPGDTISIEVGTRGGDGAGPLGGAGGSPGGGAGGTVSGSSNAGGGGGGGETIVHPSDIFQWYADAAGGGGCGGFAGPSGGNGGDAQAPGVSGSGGAGGGGTGAGGGGADVPVDSNHGTTGDIHSGGAGAGGVYAAGGGGGGGGSTGGSGGGAAAGGNGSGGGGEGGFSKPFFGTGVAIASGFGDGSATITYTPQPVPDVMTGAANDVTAAAATVAGTVNPNRLETTYHVEYGPTLRYGQATTSTSVGNGSAATSVSVPLSGLTSSTIYHYRVVATNASGTSDGPDEQLQTLGPPGVLTGPATGVSLTAATVWGSVNPIGRATTYHFEFGVTGAYGQQTPSTSAGSGSVAASVIAALTGLKEGTLYHYRIVAERDGASAFGSDQTFHTVGLPHVTTGSAASITQSSGALTGVVNPDGETTTYRFEYGTTRAYGHRTATVAAGSGFPDERVRQSISGLRPKALYHYRLVATNSLGTVRGTDRTFRTRAKATLVLRGAPRATSRGVRQTVGCSGAPCHVALTLRTVGRGGVLIGSRTVTVRAGRRAAITVSLNARGRSLRRAPGHPRATLSISLIIGSGHRQLVGARGVRLS